EDEKRLLKERGERADAVRDLAEAMKQAGAGDPDMDRKLDTLNRESSDADARALAESMNKALEKLSPEERARVAKKLAQASKSGRVSSDPEKLKDLQKELETKEGQERLEQQLKDMAKESTES